MLAVSTKKLFYLIWLLMILGISIQAQDDRNLRDRKDQSRVDSLMGRDVKFKSVLEFHLLYMNMELLRENIKFPALFSEYEVLNIYFNYQTQNFECQVKVSHEKFLDLKNKPLMSAIQTLQIITQRIQMIIGRYMPNIQQIVYFTKIDFRHDIRAPDTGNWDSQWQTFAVYQNGQISFLLNSPPSPSTTSTTSIQIDRDKSVINQVTILEGKKYINEKEFKKELGYRIDELTRFYNLKLRRNPELGGQIVLDVTLLPTGNVSDIRVNQSEIENDMFILGLLDIIRQWQFSEIGVTIRFRFSLNFKVA